MDLIGRYESALEAKQRELAVSALRSPSGHDPFTYGQACGIFLGLQMALDTLNEMVRAKNEREAAL